MANFVENDCVTGGLFLWLLHLKIGRVYLEVGSPAVYSQRCYYIILSEKQATYILPSLSPAIPVGLGRLLYVPFDWLVSFAVDVAEEDF